MKTSRDSGTGGLTSYVNSLKRPRASVGSRLTRSLRTFDNRDRRQGSFLVRRAGFVSHARTVTRMQGGGAASHRPLRFPSPSAEPGRYDCSLFLAGVQPWGTVLRTKRVDGGVGWNERVVDVVVELEERRLELRVLADLRTDRDRLPLGVEMKCRCGGTSVTNRSDGSANPTPTKTDSGMMALTPMSASLDRVFTTAPSPPSGDHPPVRAGDPPTFVTFESSRRAPPGLAPGCEQEPSRTPGLGGHSAGREGCALQMVCRS